MLKGKILTIKYSGNWIVSIDGFTKTFETFSEVAFYISRVLEKGKDQEKIELLRQDTEKLMIKRV